MDRIRQASGEGRLDELHALAHRLLGGARTVHEPAVAEAARRLEVLTGTRNVTDEALARAVREVLAAVADVVEREDGVSPPSDPAHVAPPGAPVVVAIEDDPSTRLLLERMFARIPDVQLVTAQSGREGIELAADPGVALVLLDMSLPDTDGGAVLSELAVSRRPRVPVAVISADASPAKEQAARDLGAHEYLGKPIDLERLRELVEDVCLPARRSQAETDS